MVGRERLPSSTASVGAPDQIEGTLQGTSEFLESETHPPKAGEQVDYAQRLTFGLTPRTLGLPEPRIIEGAGKQCL